MTIKPKSGIRVPYIMPLSGIARVRVVSDYPTNVRVPATRSVLLKSHTSYVHLDFGSTWGVIIENPWETHDVEAHVDVTEMYE